jgi:hypothetical protein
MPDFFLDSVDPGDGKTGVLTQQLSRLHWHLASFSQRFAGREFDGKPLRKLAFLTPDAAHRRPGISCNHKILQLK